MNRIGLLNMGSTCFMNSILYVLINNPVLILAHQFRSCSAASCKLSEINNTTAKESADSHASTDTIVTMCICCEFKELCVSWLTARSVVASQSSLQVFVPSRLLYAVWNYADYMAGYAQQDAHEFLMALLGGLQSHGKENHPLPPVPVLQEAATMSQTSAVYLPDDCDELGGPLAKKPRNDPRPKSGYRDYFTRPVQSFGEVFQGKTQSNLTCKTCGHTSTKHESFLDLSLSLIGLMKAKEGAYRRQQQRGGGKITLSECLQHFTTVETLSEKVHCEQCGSRQDRQKQLSVSSAPSSLILQLKRFDFQRNQKIATKVHFAVKDLDLYPYSSDYRSNEVGAEHSSISPRTRYQRQRSKPSITTDNLASTAAASAPPSPEMIPEIASEGPIGGNRNYLYDLQGVVCHSGSLNQGHYIAYVADYQVSTIDGKMKLQWLRCDDEEVRPVDEAAVQEAEAYILFYVQKAYITG